MKKSKTILAAALGAFCVAGVSQAQVVGEFVDLGGGVFSFEVTNNTAESFSGFDFGGIAGTGDGGFAGNFLQGVAPGSAVFDDNVNGLAFDAFPDTYFLGATPTAAANTVDTATNLEGAYNYSGSILDPGQTLTVALFSTSDQTSPTFLGGFATSQTANTEITVIPEPGSLALLGLGGMALLRRRR